VSSDLHSRVLATIDEYATSAVEDGYPVAWPLAALRAVVELHAPRRRLNGVSGELMWIECAGCLDDAPPWPCSTIQVIAAQLGIPNGPEGGH
jgi:hypothetical protein